MMAKDQVVTSSLNIIDYPGKDGFPSDITYFDHRVYLDLENKPRKLKEVVIPFELETLMPKDWDLTGRLTNPAEHFADILSDESLQRDNFTIAGRSNSNTYNQISKAVRTALSTTSKVPSIRKRDSLIHLSPFKLLLSVYNYVLNSIDDAEARDRIELLVDKLALLSLMQYILSDTMAVETAHKLPAGSSKSDFDKALAKKLYGEGASKFRLDGLRDIWPFETEKSIEISANDFKALTVLSGNQILLSVIPLDLYLDEELRRRFAEIIGKDPGKSQWQKLSSIYAGWIALQPPEFNGSEYSFFFGVVDKFMQFQYVVPEKFPNLDAVLRFRRLNTYKLPFIQEHTLLPIIQEVDVRPLVWVKEVGELNYEYKISIEKLTSVNALPSKTPLEVDQRAQLLRQANRGLFEVRKAIEELRDEVEAGGCGLIFDPDSTTDQYLKLSKLGEVISNVEIKVREIRTDTERVSSEHIYAYRRWAHVERSYSQRTRTDVREWMETVKRVEIKPVPVNIETLDWRPIDSYLKQDFPDQKLLLEDQEAKSLLLKVFGKNAIAKDNNGEEHVYNQHKDVRLFELYDGGYRDQYGYSLETLLYQCEDPITRFKTLLVLPIYERRLNGSAELIKYLMIHNPVAPRRSFIEPRIFLIQTFRHVLGQEPGHWQGPLSHTVSLFPGELRKMKICSETKVVTQQKQESKSTQRSTVEQKTNVRKQVKSELTSTSKDAKKSSWDVSASAGASWGWGRASVKGGKSGSSESSAERVASNLQDSVSEALQSASEDNEVQFATSSETTTTQSSTSEQIIEFQNVNQARAITHKFFQILHKFQSSIFIDDLRILIEYGEKVLPGVDIYKTQVFSLRDLHEEKVFDELDPKERENVLKDIVTAIEGLVDSKYLQVEEGKVVGVDRMEPVKQITPHYVNSGSFFVETQVSTAPSTEQYIDAARQAEVSLQLAKSERMLREADALEKGRLVLPAELESFSIYLDSKTPILSFNGHSNPRQTDAVVDDNKLDEKPTKPKQKKQL